MRERESRRPTVTNTLKEAIIKIAKNTSDSRVTMDLAVASRHLLLEKFINVCPIFDSHCSVLPFFSFA